MEKLSLFLHTDTNRTASQHDIADFCSSVDTELDRYPNLDAWVSEIVHYKEKVQFDGLSYFLTDIR